MLTDVNSLRFRKELSVSWEQGFTYNKAGVYKGWVIKGEGCHGGYDGRRGGHVTWQSKLCLISTHHVLLGSDGV